VSKNYLPPEPGHVSTTAHELLVERDAARQELATLQVAAREFMEAEKERIWSPTDVYVRRFNEARHALAALVGADDA
jgi:hypothetical protein